MLACPNINTREWKDLVQAIGQKEAFREYMKLNTGAIPSVIDFLPIDQVRFAKLEDNENVNILKEDVAKDLMEFLEKKFPGIKGDIINDKSKKWKGRLVDGKVPTINLAYAEASDGFHEFSHPFLMALRKSNLELFNSLYDDLKNTTEWEEINRRAVERVNALYPELKGVINLNLYKEEVLATAIGYAAELKLATSKVKISNNLGRIIDRIFKWIKNFFSEFFANAIKTNDLSPNTTFGEIVDMFVDTRTQILLDANWDKATDNLIVADAMIGAISLNQEILTNQLANDIAAEIQVDKPFNLDEYINNWLDKTFKLPKKEYKPRKQKPDEIALAVARSMVEIASNSGFRLKGMEIKQRKAIADKLDVKDETLEKLASILTPIALNYKFSNYLSNKKNVAIALNQPLVTIKQKEKVDEDGTKYIENTPNLPISLAEAEAVLEFQAYIQNKYPDRRSMLSDELNQEYVDWVTENYGINWTEATGHMGYGMERISSVPYTHYTRILFIDDYLNQNKHQFNIDKTELLGNGLGWYASVSINGDRFDHEFQSDILPEISESYKKGEYSPVVKTGITRQNKKEKLHSLATSKLEKMMVATSDYLLLNNNFLYDEIMRADSDTKESLAISPEIDEDFFLETIDDDIPFSKLDTYDVKKFTLARDFLISELEVQIEETKNIGKAEIKQIHYHKGLAKIYNLFLSRKNEQQKVLFDWIKTFSTTVEKESIDELPFSKIKETPTRILLFAIEGKKYYATNETIEKFPDFLKKIYDVQLEWANSGAPIKPPVDSDFFSFIITMARNTSPLLDERGNIKKNFGKTKSRIQKIRDQYRNFLEKNFKKYNFFKKRLKALEWRRNIYSRIDAIIKMTEYYKGQYNRFYRFYANVYEAAIPIAIAEVSAKKPDVSFNRYKKYNDLYYKWFDIIVPHSINSAKAEGRPYYYLPTAMAMNAIEGNSSAEKVYWTPADSVIKPTMNTGLSSIEAFVLQNTPESTEVVRQYLPQRILQGYTAETTPDDIARDLLFLTNFIDSPELNEFLINQPPVSGIQNGPLYIALVKYARKNNIKITFEKPSWAKQTLIKVDLTNYVIKPIDRFSKISDEFLTRERIETIPVPTEADQKKELGQGVVYAIANRLSDTLGVKGQVVTREQARDITSTAQNPWNGEPAFFYDGKVYFVEDGFNLDNVLHEYSHPLVSAIAANNKPLFDKIYEELLNTAEGQAIQAEVEQLGYKSENPLDVQKEIMVRALAKEAQTKLDNVPTSNNFKDVIKRILFAIKQALRKVFGTGIKVDKLSVNTTLADLAKMLTTEKFVFDIEIISEKDYVEYAREHTEFFKSFDDIQNSAISTTISRYYNLIKNQLNQIKNSKNFAEARKVLIDDATGLGLLSEIRQSLETTTDIKKIKDKTTELLTDLEKREKNVKNLTYALLRFDILTQKVSDRLKEIIKNPNTKEVLTGIFYYDLLVRNWSKFISETNQRLVDEGMDPGSSLGKVLSSTQTRIEGIQRLIQKSYEPGVVDVLYDQLSGLREGIDKNYAALIDKAKEKGSKRREEELVAEYEKVRITKERISELLLGKAGDTNVASMLLEAAYTNPDPVVSGFATLIKDAYNDVDAQTQRNVNSFLREMAPLLRKAGYSMTNFTSLMREIAFIDKKVVRNSETNEVDTVEVWTFLNPFKNVNTELKTLSFAYEAAMEEGNEQEADSIIKKMRQHRKDYFHQEYVDEYYQREEIYDSLEKNPDLEDATYNALGIDKSKATAADKQAAAVMYDVAAKEAYRRKHTILNTIQEKDSANFDPENYETIAEQKKALWKEYSQIASLTNLDGNLKEGQEYLIAAIERKYRKESNKFFEFVLIPGSFEFALEKFEQDLIDAKIAKDSDEFIEKRKKWILNNTVVKFTKAFYEERARILTDIRSILSRLPDNIRLKVDSTSEFEEIVDTTVGFRDNNGQIVGSDISENAKARVKKLQEAIRDKRDKYVGFSGLTKDEYDEFTVLIHKIKSKQQLTQREKLRLDELNERKAEFGVDKPTQVKLNALYTELSNLQSKEATDYYLDIVNNWFGKMGVPDRIDNESAEEILYPNKYVDLFQKSAEFKDWFLKNHIRKEVFDPKTDQNIIVYERLYVWNKVIPNDPDHYETITLPSGEVIPGSPNLSYYFRKVKNEPSDLKYLRARNPSELTNSEKTRLKELTQKEASGKLVSYRTEKIVGKTVDNKGNFLPKTLAEGAKSDSPYFNADYENLKTSDPAKFAVLEKIKEYHLRFQEEMAKESRLYLEAPRYESQAIENLQLNKKINAGKRLFLNIRKRFFGANDDYDRNLNFNPGQLVYADMFNEEIRKIPVTGLYKLKPDEVSMNFLDSMMRYMHSGLMQKKLIELNSFAQAIETVVSNPKNSTSIINKFVKWIYQLTGDKVPIKQEGYSNRARAIRNLISREFEGRRVADITANIPSLWKLKSNVGKLVSLSSFALNLPSALKNRNAAVVQGFIEASGGRFLDLESYALGKARAAKAMILHSSQIYTLKNKSLDVQLMQIFDPSQNFFSKVVKGQFGRSVLADAADFSFLMAPRAFLQLEATTEVMFGMLYHEKVKQTINGQSNEIRYVNAFHIVNGQIELKPGIDQEYAPGGKKFNEIKNKIHQIGDNLEGNYSRFGQPEIYRYFIGQAVLFFKQYFTSMFMNWFAVKRPNAMLGTTSSGNFTAFFRGIKNFVLYAKNGENYFRLMDPEEAAAARKVVALVSSIAMMLFGLELLFNYEDDDDDKYKIMDRRSGPLFSDKFNLKGWLTNQLAVVTLSTLLEVETFANPRIFINTAYRLPNPEILFDMGIKRPYEIIDNAFGNLIGDPTSYYQQDVHGAAYPWQKKGGSKAMAELAKMFGFTGTFLSPRMSMENIQKQLEGRGR